MMPNNDPKINEYPSIFWAKFFNRFSEIDNLPIKEWSAVHLLSYFSKRYKDHYGVKFSFKFNTNSPSKSYEIFQIRKLGQILSSDPEILKDYIDWFFDNKIILKKKRITSLSFLTDTINANEYKFKRLGMDKSQNIERTTPLPPSLIEIAIKLNVMDCKTYGDLTFIYKVIETADVYDDECKFIDEIKRNGFDLSILSKVK